MNHISAEEFLKQSDKTRDKILKWWKPQIGEIIYSTGISSGEQIYLGDYEDNAYEVFRINEKCKAITDKKIFIPLLQIHSLIEFLEYKNSYIEITGNIDNSKLLQALWEMVIRICEGNT